MPKTTAAAQQFVPPSVYGGVTAHGGGGGFAAHGGGGGGGSGGFSIPVPIAGQTGDIPHSRFRSFAERYVIERARTFQQGNELEDAWQATLQARTIYNQIAAVANSVDKR